MEVRFETLDLTEGMDAEAPVWEDSRTMRGHVGRQVSPRRDGRLPTTVVSERYSDRGLSRGVWR